MTSPLFQTAAIIGFGLIGSSMARALKAKGVAGTVVGADVSAEVCAQAEQLGLADRMTDDLAGAVERADLVVLAVPVGAVRGVLEAVADSLQAGAIITDVGSVKGSVVRDVNAVLADASRYVPGHPIAGAENSGPGAGSATLFDGRWTILTPGETTSEDAVQRVRAMWEAFGSSVEIMDVAHHDLVLAITSHLPHLIAYNIVGTAADLETVTRSEVIKFSAGGFRDFTRIAASDPVMWRDVFMNNRDAVLETLGRFSEDLSALQRAIRWGDGDALEELFTRTRAIRRGIIDAGQDSDAPDFGRGSLDKEPATAEPKPGKPGT